LETGIKRFSDKGNRVGVNARPAEERLLTQIDEVGICVNHDLIHRPKHLYLVLIMGLLLAFLLSSCTSSGYKWKKQYQPQETLGFWGISVIDSQSAWAVGYGLDTGGEIYFYDGSDWNLSYKADEWIQGISAVDRNHAWAVGRDVNKETGVIYSFDGSVWRKQYEVNDQYGIRKAFALNDHDVWAVGGSGGIYYYDGSAWKEQTGPGIDVNSIHATDTSHVWATGGNSIYFWDGRIWAKQLDSDANLMKIVGRNQNNLCAVGGVQDQDRGKIYSYDGSNWSESLETDWRLRSISIDDSGNVWAVGFKSSEADYLPTSEILHNDGSKWQVEYKAQEALTDIAASPGGDIWAVGTYGGIYLGTR
jgi:hypothetical protein